MTVSKCVIDLAMRVLPTQPIDHVATISYVMHTLHRMHSGSCMKEYNGLEYIIWLCFVYPCIRMIAIRMHFH